MKKAKGILIMAIVMCALSIIAFRNGIARTDFPLYLRWINIGYGITALSTSIGLWRMEKWAKYSFVLWSVPLFATLIDFQYMNKKPWDSLIGLYVIILFVLYGLYSYIGRKTA